MPKHVLSHSLYGSGMAYLGSLPRVSQSGNQGVRWAAFSLQARLGKNLLLSSFRLLAEFICLWLYN